MLIKDMNFGISNHDYKFDDKFEGCFYFDALNIYESCNIRAVEKVVVYS